MSTLIGLVIGGIIAHFLPNPLIWLDDRYQDWKWKKHCKKRFDELVAKGISEKTASEITGHNR